VRRRRAEYCNPNYILLGYVIEKASGRQPAQQYLTTLIGDLRLPNTSYPTGNTLPEPFAHGYLSDGTEPPPAGGYRDVTVSTPAVPARRPDRLHRSGHDPLRRRAGHGRRAVPCHRERAPELGTADHVGRAAAVRPRDHPARGLGRPRRVIFGYRNMVFYLPSEQATVVVMSNAADEIAVPSQALWGEIVKVLYPDSLPSW
jgi:D-alanyl-D-alanine carboxypeptidase